jgi:6-pyruvoyltetrahydropterin/6-carboxytetrahydropterin synthase
LDKAGLAIDYFDVKDVMDETIQKLDHFNVNDIPPFDEINPSAENMACWFFQELKNNFRNPLINLHAVTLWEDEDFCVRYTEPK